MNPKFAEQITADWCIAVRLYLDSAQGVATIRHVPRAEREALGLTLEGCAPVPSDADKSTRSSLAVWKTGRLESARASLELALYVEDAKSYDDDAIERRFLELQGRGRGLIAEIIRFARETMDPVLDAGDKPTPLISCDTDIVDATFPSERVTCPTIYNEAFLAILKDPSLAFEGVDWTGLDEPFPESTRLAPKASYLVIPPPPPSIPRASSLASPDEEPEIIIKEEDIVRDDD